MAVLSGLALAVQGRINGELTRRVGDGLLAAGLSFLTGFVLLLLLVPTRRAGRRSLAQLTAALRAGSLRWWQCLGGLCGAFVVLSQGLTVAAMGVAIFTVALVAGQSGSSLWVDQAGLGAAAPQPITGYRVAGAALSVVAVVVAVADRLGHPSMLILAVLPLLAGIGGSWQVAVNTRVRAAAGSALTATFVNFLAGGLGLAVACAVDLAVRGGPTAEIPREWWLYLGGVIGVGFVAVAAVLARRMGVLLFGLGVVAGQLVGAVVIDAAVPGGYRPTPLTVVGVALTLVAVLLAAGGAQKPAPLSLSPTSGPGTGAPRDQ